MKPQNIQKLKELELPKIGIAGVIFFIVQFLYGQIETDSSEFSKDISALLVSSASVNQRLIGVESQVAILTEKTGKRYTSDDADRERDVIDKEIDRNRDQLQFIRNELAEHTKELVLLKARLDLLTKSNE